MSKRQLISSGPPYEPTIGFSRAVRVDNHIFVSATGPIEPDGKCAYVGDLFGQVKYCLEIIISAVEEAGGTTKDIVRTRLFIKDIDNWQNAAKAHGLFFGDIRPACSFIGSTGFLDPDFLVEIEADAYINA